MPTKKYDRSGSADQICKDNGKGLRMDYYFSSDPRLFKPVVFVDAPHPNSGHCLWRYGIDRGLHQPFSDPM